MLNLKGLFKGEHNMRWHMVPIADEGKSGIPTRRWITRLLYRRVKLEKAKRGYLLSKANGKKATIGDYDPLFRDYVTRAIKANLKAKRDVFRKGVDPSDYSLRRSPRRGSTTTATNNNVDPLTIELVNRWRKREKAKGAEPSLPMRQVYTQVRNAIDATLRSSQSH